MLKSLSQKAREYRKKMIDVATAEGNSREVERWSMARVNDIIAGWYKEETGATEFRSFRQWELAGYYVERGSKAFTLWGRRRNATKPATPASGEEPEMLEYDFFPLAYLFSDKQVKPKTDSSNESASMPAAEATAEAAEATGGATAEASAPSRFEKAFAA